MARGRDGGDNQSVDQQTNISVSQELAKTLRREAESAGLGMDAYLRLLQAARDRGHDREFLDAAKKTFKQYPRALRDLAQ